MIINTTTTKQVQYIYYNIFPFNFYSIAHCCFVALPHHPCSSTDQLPVGQGLQILYSYYRIDGRTNVLLGSSTFQPSSSLVCFFASTCLLNTVNLLNSFELDRMLTRSLAEGFIVLSSTSSTSGKAYRPSLLLLLVRAT